MNEDKRIKALKELDIKITEANSTCAEINSCKKCPLFLYKDPQFNCLMEKWQSEIRKLEKEIKDEHQNQDTKNK